MIYYYLLADLIHPPPPHPIWIEHLTKKVMFTHFYVCKRPPPPHLTVGMVEVCLREAAAFKNISYKQHVFHNILQGISIVYTFIKLHNYSKCKNFRHLLQRAQDTDGLSFAFHGRALQFIFISDRDFFFFDFFILFCNNKINNLYRQK